ncbi:MAG: hypothetical protein U9R23_06655 [Candidatus Cloacimonadota bacterium]|nr:hypothetical protein [Candidatus Cloacimonadota bacterium]
MSHEITLLDNISLDSEYLPGQEHLTGQARTITHLPMHQDK